MIPNKKVIAITGGIGSGKSFAGDVLRAQGYTVIDADEISRELSKSGQYGFKGIMDAFGEGYLTAQGEIDRKRLSETVFSDKEKLQLLNNILHPLIEREIFKRAEMAVGKIVFVEIPLLTEVSYINRFDQIWTISADENIRMKRAAKRDGVNEELIAARMKHQADDLSREEIADIIIYNNGDKKSFESNILKKLQSFLII